MIGYAALILLLCVSTGCYAQSFQPNIWTVDTGPTNSLNVSGMTFFHSLPNSEQSDSVEQGFSAYTSFLAGQSKDIDEAGPNIGGSNSKPQTFPSFDTPSLSIDTPSLPRNEAAPEASFTPFQSQPINTVVSTVDNTARGKSFTSLELDKKKSTIGSNLDLSKFGILENNISDNKADLTNSFTTGPSLPAPIADKPFPFSQLGGNNDSGRKSPMMMTSKKFVDHSKLPVLRVKSKFVDTSNIQMPSNTKTTLPLTKTPPGTTAPTILPTTDAPNKAVWSSANNDQVGSSYGATTNSDSGTDRSSEIDAIDAVNNVPAFVTTTHKHVNHVDRLKVDALYPPVPFPVFNTENPTDATDNDSPNGVARTNTGSITNTNTDSNGVTSTIGNQAQFNGNINNAMVGRSNGLQDTSQFAQNNLIQNNNSGSSGIQRDWQSTSEDISDKQSRQFSQNQNFQQTDSTNINTWKGNVPVSPGHGFNQQAFNTQTSMGRNNQMTTNNADIPQVLSEQRVNSNMLPTSIGQSTNRQQSGVNAQQIPQNNLLPVSSVQQGNGNFIQSPLGNQLNTNIPQAPNGQIGIFNQDASNTIISKTSVNGQSTMNDLQTTLPGQEIRTSIPQSTFNGQQINTNVPATTFNRQQINTNTPQNTFNGQRINTQGAFLNDQQLPNGQQAILNSQRINTQFPETLGTRNSQQINSQARVPNSQGSSILGNGNTVQGPVSNGQQLTNGQQTSFNDLMIGSNTPQSMMNGEPIFGRGKIQNGQQNVGQVNLLSGQPNIGLGNVPIGQQNVGQGNVPNVQPNIGQGNIPNFQPSIGQGNIPNVQPNFSQGNGANIGQVNFPNGQQNFGQGNVPNIQPNGQQNIGQGNTPNGLTNIGQGNVPSGQQMIGQGNVPNGQQNIRLGNVLNGQQNIGQVTFSNGRQNIGQGNVPNVQPNIGRGNIPNGQQNIGQVNTPNGLTNIGQGNVPIGQQNIGQRNIPNGQQNIGLGNVPIGQQDIGPGNVLNGQQNLVQGNVNNQQISRQGNAINSQQAINGQQTMLNGGPGSFSIIPQSTFNDQQINGRTINQPKTLNNQPIDSSNMQTMNNNQQIILQGSIMSGSETNQINRQLTNGGPVNGNGQLMNGNLSRLTVNGQTLNSNVPQSVPNGQQVLIDRSGANVVNVNQQNGQDILTPMVNGQQFSRNGQQQNLMPSDQRQILNGPPFNNNNGQPMFSGQQPLPNNQPADGQQRFNGQQFPRNFPNGIPQSALNTNMPNGLTSQNTMNNGQFQNMNPGMNSVLGVNAFPRNSQNTGTQNIIPDTTANQQSIGGAVSSTGGMNNRQFPSNVPSGNIPQNNGMSRNGFSNLHGNPSNIQPRQNSLSPQGFPNTGPPQFGEPPVGVPNGPQNTLFPGNNNFRNVPNNFQSMMRNGNFFNNRGADPFFMNRGPPNFSNNPNGMFPGGPVFK